MKNAPLSLFAFDVFAPAHLTAGSWRAEGDEGHRYTDLKYWTGVARMLEDASFDGIFFADTVGLHDVYGGSGDESMRDAAQFPINDPTVLISGMAAVTEHLTFGVTCSLTYEQPYLLARRWLPRYAVVVTLAVGIAWAALNGQMRWSAVHLALAVPVFTAPQFSVQALMSLALPLFIVTMASQNLPGVAVMRATGYQLPVSRLISMTGLATLVLAPFGAFALNFSAITAAICMGPEAHPDPARRYTAAASCGLLYIAVGLFGAVVTGLLTAFPPELVVAIAGLALLGAIGGGLASALADDAHREAALITFLVTLSGVSIAGIGSAFWGVVAGSSALFVQQYGRTRTQQAPRAHR